MTSGVAVVDEISLPARTTCPYVSVNSAVPDAPPVSVATMDFWPATPALPRRGIIPGQENVPLLATMAVHNTDLAFLGFFFPDM